MALVAETLSIVEELRRRHSVLKEKYRNNQELLTRALETIEKLEKDRENRNNSPSVQDVKTTYEVLFGGVKKSETGRDLGFSDRENRLVSPSPRVTPRHEDNSMTTPRNETSSRVTPRIDDTNRVNPRIEETSLVSYPPKDDAALQAENKLLQKDNERLKRLVSSLEDKIAELKAQVQKKDNEISNLITREPKKERNIEEKTGENKNHLMEKQMLDLEKENKELMNQLEKARKERESKSPETSRLMTPLSGSSN